MAANLTIDALLSQGVNRLSGARPVRDASTHTLDAELILVCLSGRGDKDVQQVSQMLGL